MSLIAVWTMFIFEMSRFFRSLVQSLISPVISTSLYFVVFGAAIGSNIRVVEGIPYGAFIVPGLVMLTVMTQSVSNASFGIYFPKFMGMIYEHLSAPVSFLEIVVAYAGAAAAKSLIIGSVIMITATFFVEISIMHPLAAIGFFVLTSISFSLLGFIVGIWADNFEQLQLVPFLVITPLVFLGGSFYSITILPGIWYYVSLFNPVVYLISGFRWAFFGQADVPVGLSLLAITVFSAGCIGFIWWIFRTGWRIRQ